MNIKIIILYFLILNSFSINAQLIENKNYLDQKIDSIIGLMNLDEKIGQMNQYNGFWDATGPTPKQGEQLKKYESLKKGLVGSMLNVRGVEEISAIQKIAVNETRLGIPLIFANDVIHGYKTLSPIPLAEAASWDLKEIENSARIAALEASSSGTNWTFAPMVDISRDARWGRVMEGAGEDPFLSSLIAEARIKGFQGDDLSKHNTIAATAKHFAAYGFSESGRDYNTVDIGENTLYNTVFPPFMKSVESGVATVMTGFNDLDGIPVTANSELIQKVLRQNWNFQGVVISDWGSIREMIPHGYAQNPEKAAESAIKAGTDIDMESNIYLRKLKQLVEDQIIDEELIDQSVRKILRLKFELGLFDDPFRYLDKQRERDVINSTEIQKDILRMAKKSIVLLKNNEGLLPLKKENLKIALIGALASDKNSPLGNWRTNSDDNTAVSVLEGMSKYPDNELIYEKGADVILNEGGVVKFHESIILNKNDKSGFSDAINVASKSDIAIVVIGEDGFQSGEGRSRSKINIPGVQLDLLKEIFKVNKKVILVLMNGRPLDLTWADENIPAILETWQLGTQTGNAIAQVLYGDYNPSGKLPMSFPRNVGQIPIYYNHKSTGRPGPKKVVFWSHFNDVSNTPLYPFGYGLSYTTFEYSNLEIDNKLLKKNQVINASVLLKNSGKYNGREVVQLYIRDKFGSITRPVRELKGFKLIDLVPGEVKKVNFEITESMLRFYERKQGWISEPGVFEIFIGSDSNADLKETFELIK